MSKSEIWKLVAQWLGLIIYAIAISYLFPNKATEFYLGAGLIYGVIFRKNFWNYEPENKRS